MAGALDHSTNTIILDAVLTTRGRAYLARFDGSFQIVKFALTDDEIQYNLIRQYGRIIGKEYIEKLTPVIEANTNAAATCKYHLIGASDQRIARLPFLRMTGPTLVQINPMKASGTLTIATANRQAAVSVSQVMGKENATISDDLKDSVFLVKMRHDQFRIAGQTPMVTEGNMATYRMLANGVNRQQGGTVDFTLTVAASLLDPNRYGNNRGDAVNQSINANAARGFVKIKGVQSGARFDLDVTVTKS